MEQVIQGSFENMQLSVSAFVEIKSNYPLLTKKELFKQLLKSNLDFGVNKKNQIARHYWHSFPAKFPPALPKFFIENLTAEDQVVLDPMAGSCTTLIEASGLNRQAIGFDIDPLSLIIGNAKLSNIDVTLTKTKGTQIFLNARETFENNIEELHTAIQKRFDKESIVFLDYWFEKKTQLELMALLQQIESVEEKNIENFFKLIFSSIIITKSGGVTLAYDLAHTRPHKVLTKKPSSALDEFAKKLYKLLNSGYQDLSANSFLKNQNAKNPTLADESVDLIITSPPYANNAIDYMRAHKFSLIWFGHKISELKSIRKKYIGSETVHTNLPLILPDYPYGIINDLGLINNKKSKSLHFYFEEMQQVIKEMYRVLKPQNACVIVVASSVLAGMDVMTHVCLAEIGKKAGFELIHIGKRNIHRDSRMLPSSLKKNSSQIEARMHNEFVIGLWKS